MFTSILVPTDFSPGADAALATARRLADQFGASLHLLHVMPDPFTTMMMSVESYVPDVTALRDAMKQDATAKVDLRLSESDHTKLHAHGEVVFGADAQSIVEYAGSHGIDLIVMGTHGRTGMAHLLLGSVAERVVRTAPCTVMTVRETAGRKVTAVPDVAAAA